MSYFVAELPTVGQTVNLQVTIPSCLTAEVTGIQWNYGDNSLGATNANASHAYAAAGEFVQSVTVSTMLGNFTLKNEITISGPVVVDPKDPTPPVLDPVPVPNPPAPQSGKGCKAGTYYRCIPQGAGISGWGTCENGYPGNCIISCHEVFAPVSPFQTPTWYVISNCGSNNYYTGMAP